MDDRRPAQAGAQNPAYRPTHPLYVADLGRNGHRVSWLNVLFVTGDIKGDWWHKEHGEVEGPLPELAYEMRVIAGVRLFMLRPESLLVHAGKVLSIQISSESVHDAERVTAELLDSYPYAETSTGRSYRLVDLTSAGSNRPASVYEWRGVRPPEGRHWKYNMETMDRMDMEGRIHFHRGRPFVKRYLDEQPGGLSRMYKRQARPACGSTKRQQPYRPRLSAIDRH